MEKFTQKIDCNQVEKISIIGWGEMISKFLLNFTNLTCLILNQSNMTLPDDLEVINLPNLTELSASGYFWVLKLIKNHKVKKFHCNDGGMKFFNDLDVLQNFFHTCHDLKHLILTSKIPNFNYTDFGFELEILEVKDSKPPKNFKDFLESQKNSLKTLKLFIDKVDDEISHLIYFEMKLEKLLDCRKSFRKVESDLKINKTVKSLTIPSKKEIKNLKFFETILIFCESLEFLDTTLVHGKEKESLEIISKIPKLKVLVLRDLIGENFGDFELSEETKFDVEKMIIYAKVTPSIINLINQCPNLKNLQIFDESYGETKITSNDFKNIFSSCPKLTKLYICSHLKLRAETIKVLANVDRILYLKMEVNNLKIYSQAIESLMNTKTRLTVMEKRFNCQDLKSFKKIELEDDCFVDFFENQATSDEESEENEDEDFVINEE